MPFTAQAIRDAGSAPSWGGASGAVGNRAAYGSIPNLPLYTTDTTKQVGTDVYSQLVQNLPGYQAMVGKSSENIGDQLAGRLPQDVIDLMTQQGAERGIATGAPGSPNANAAYLRALGLTSLGVMQGAEPQLTAAVQRTPIQQTNVQTQTTDLGAARAQYAAAPDPYLAAMAALGAGQQGIAAGRGSIGGGGYAPAPIGYGGYANAPSGWAAEDAWQNAWNNANIGTGGFGTLPDTSGYEDWLSMFEV